MGNALTNALEKPEDAELKDAMCPFDNLHMHCIEMFWQSFYEYCCTFAVTKSGFRKVCSNSIIKAIPHTSPEYINENADNAFDIFAITIHQDDNSSTNDEESRVMDMLEFLSAIVFIGDMPIDEKIDLLFDSYDMSEDGLLELDEFTISLKSTLFGLSKILKSKQETEYSPLQQNVVPGLSDDEVDKIAKDTFQCIATQLNPGKVANKKISCEDFRFYCQNHEKAKSLLKLFDILAPSIHCSTGDEIDLKTKLLHSHSSLDDMTINTTSFPNTDLNGDIISKPEIKGDEFLAIKPWKGAIITPLELPPLRKDAPSADIQLDWIFGYGSCMSKNDVLYIPAADRNSPAEIIYPAAGACVVLNTSKMTQRHFLNHKGDVISVAIHPKGRIVATGELAKRPQIIVWDLGSLGQKCCLIGFHQRGIPHINFCSDTILISIGGDDDHSVGVYESNDNWDTSILRAFSKGNKNIPSDLATISRSCIEFVTCGPKYIDMWTMKSSSLSSRKAILGKKGTLQHFLSCSYFGTYIAIGTHDGSIYIFDDKVLSKAIKVHDSPINTVFAVSNCLVMGSKSGCVHVWDIKFNNLIPPLELQAIISGNLGCLTSYDIRSCVMSIDQKKIMIGTAASEIYELDCRSIQYNSATNTIQSIVLTQGHFSGELWGLAAHPNISQCCTVGDDATLRLWDISDKGYRQLQSFVLKYPARACSYSNDGQLIAIGLGAESSSIPKAGGKARSSNTKATMSFTGGFMVLNASNLSVVKDVVCAQNRWVSDIKFSPDDRMLAVASHDTNIYLYNSLQGFKEICIFNKHSSYISHIDFSCDGKYLQSTSGAYEILYCETKSGKHITQAASILRDERWHSMTSILGWPVQGIWEDASDGTDINAVDRSNDNTLLATGDDFGKVKLFWYPCTVDNAPCIKLRGHSSHVTNVRWSFNDKYIFSTGGRDRCLFVWKQRKSALITQ